MNLSDDPRQRLLTAAECVFAEKGFKAASVRDIVRRAGTNVAAVNYYFGDKERLYSETVKNAYRQCTEGIPLPDWAPGTPAEQKLRDFIRVLVMRMLRPQAPTATQLMMREMAQPTAACAEWVGEYIRPLADTLRAILAELLPQTAEADQWLIGFSIVGQCLFYRQNRPAIAILVGDEAFQRLDADRVAEHICRFTLAALGRVPAAPQNGVSV
jgi:AcrR family transcriptional regulator